MCTLVFLLMHAMHVCSPGVGGNSALCMAGLKAGTVRACAAQEHDRVLDEVPECARALLRARMDALEQRLAPGCSLLTWASMNIDGYLRYARQVLGHYFQSKQALLPCMQ